MQEKHFLAQMLDWTSWLDLESLKQALILKGTEGASPCMVHGHYLLLMSRVCVSFSFLVGPREGSTGARTWGLMHERQVVYHWTTPTLSLTPSATNELINPEKKIRLISPGGYAGHGSILKCLQPCSPEGIGDFYCSFLREKKMHTRFRSQCITHS